MAGTEFQLDEEVFLVMMWKLVPTLRRNRRKRINYRIHTIGPFPFHKERAGSVIFLKARHHRFYTAWAAYWEVKRGHLFQKPYYGELGCKEMWLAKENVRQSNFTSLYQSWVNYCSVLYAFVELLVFFFFSQVTTKIHLATEAAWSILRSVCPSVLIGKKLQTMRKKYEQAWFKQ